MTRRDFLTRLTALLLTWRLPAQAETGSTAEAPPLTSEQGGLITIPFFVGAPNVQRQTVPTPRRVYLPMVSNE